MFQIFRTPQVHPVHHVHPLGEHARSGDYAVTVEQLIDDFLAADGALPAEGRRLVAARVALVNVANAQGLAYGPSRWMLYDTEGYAFEHESRSALACDPRLPSGFVALGARVRGWVTFSVPRSAVLSHVQFFVGYLSGCPVDFACPR